MVFSFLKYLRPIWYFNLKPKIDNGYFPTISQLEKAQYEFVLDNDFISNDAKERFVGWQAFNEGFINKEFSYNSDTVIIIIHFTYL